ncbi:hypothetical protein ACS0TY_030817 [Phlomoides rotata]
MSYLCEVSDEDCKDQLRMDRAAFHKLCFILQSVCGLKCSRRVSVAEKRSGQTVSKHFHVVLNSVMRLHAMFLVKPQPITEDDTDPHWQSFQAAWELWMAPTLMYTYLLLRRDDIGTGRVKSLSTC